MIDTYTLLEKPYSIEELTELATANDGTVTGVIKVALDDLMSNDYESVLDLLSESVTGSTAALVDLRFRVVGSEPGDLVTKYDVGYVHLEVSGDVGDYLDFVEDDYRPEREGYSEMGLE